MAKDEIDDDLQDEVEKATGLVDMKRTKAELKEEKERWKDCGPSNGDAYPYGLELRLEDASLAKLGVEDLPVVGERVRITAVAIVEAASFNEQLGSDGKKKRANRNLTLQIQKLKISKGGE